MDVASGDHGLQFAAGQVVVLRPDRAGPDVVATNTLPIDGRVYGVAVSRGRFIVRTGRALLSVGTPGDRP